MTNRSCIGIYSENADFLNENTKRVETFVEQCCLDCDIYSMDSYQKLKKIAQKGMFFSIILLDLDGKEWDSWEVAAYIKYVGANCEIIGISSKVEDAVKSYRLEGGMKDFLLKPLAGEALTHSLANAIKENPLIQKIGKKIMLRSNGIYTDVYLDQIICVESSGHSLIFSLANGTEIKVLASFRDYSSLLEQNKNFLRCHQSYIVNLKYVEDIKNTSFILESGKDISISRKYKQQSRFSFLVYKTDYIPYEASSEEFG